MAHRINFSDGMVKVYTFGATRPKVFKEGCWTKDGHFTVWNDREVRQYLVREWLSTDEVRATLVERLEVSE